MVRNSVAIQQGYDPTAASMTFYNGLAETEPGPFFSVEGDRWLWPGDGALFPSGPLLLTFALVAESDEGLGFETMGSTAFLIDNPDAAPPLWRMRQVELPPHDLGTQLGAGALLIEDDWLYAFAPVEPGSHDVYLARWPIEDTERGDLSSQIEPVVTDEEAGQILQEMTWSKLRELRSGSPPSVPRFRPNPPPGSTADGSIAPR